MIHHLRYHLHRLGLLWRRITRRDQLHTHQCPACGMVWRHTDQARGCEVSHTCPRCGRPAPTPWD